jgi:predicted nucleic acid-binding protein
MTSNCGMLDTSSLFCYLHAAEPQHVEAVRLFDGAVVRLTHSYVLAEFVPLCGVRRVQRMAALDFAADLIDNPNVEIVWVDAGLHRAAMFFLNSRLDKDYSLSDAVSFLLMREYGITAALTTDHHFEQEGFVRLLKP